MCDVTRMSENEQINLLIILDAGDFAVVTLTGWGLNTVMCFNKHKGTLFIKEC